MPKASTSKPTGPRSGRKALSPEARENQLITLAVDLAEQQLRDGTASSQVITHFLKQSTAKTQLELEKLRNENLLLEAKTKQIESGEEMKQLYDNAIKAMRNYAGYGDPDEYYD